MELIITEAEMELCIFICKKMKKDKAINNVSFETEGTNDKFLVVNKGDYFEISKVSGTEILNICLNNLD